MKVISHATNVRRVPDLNFRENPSISRLDTRAKGQWCNVQCSRSVGKLARCVVSVSRFSDMYRDETPTTAIRNTGEYISLLWSSREVRCVADANSHENPSRAEVHAKAHFGFRVKCF